MCGPLFSYDLIKNLCFGCKNSTILIIVVVFRFALTEFSRYTRPICSSRVEPAQGLVSLLDKINSLLFLTLLQNTFSRVCERHTVKLLAANNRKNYATEFMSKQILCLTKF